MEDIKVVPDAFAKETDASTRETDSIDRELESSTNLPESKRGTNDDARDMYRMGKSQEMRRNFRFITIFGFSMILMASWEVALGTSFYALINGGTAGFIWMHFVAWTGFLCINISMAEMGSMAPTSGGQYHWVSEFAPRNYQKFWSFIIGWLCVLGWQTGSANTAYLGGLQIQGLLILNYPNYVPQPWHGTLLCIAVVTFGCVFNIFLAKRLPLIEGSVLIVHVFGFFAVLITLWVLGPRGNAHEVFTTFNNYGGWSTNGASALIGIMAVILPLLGADAAVHMSEELRDASKTLPQAMIWSTVINGIMGLIMIITFCMVLGNIDDVLASPTGQPFIAVFYQATQSYAGTNALSAIIIFQQIFCNLSIVATASRQLFAFARDKGVPFHKWFAYVRPGWDVPVNSIIMSWIVTCLLALINLGSVAAFNNVASLSISGVMASYIISIGCLTYKRLRNEPLLPSKFHMSRITGLVINFAALFFVCFFFVLVMFPTNVNPSLVQMNWCVVMLVGIVVLCLVHYFFQGRHIYDGPVEYVRKGI